MDGVKPKTYCEKWPLGCMMCDLLLCDGKKNQPAVKMYAPGELEIEANNLLRKMVGAKPYKPQTNADRIRAMTDEELAEWMDDVCKSAYYKGYTKETGEPLMSPYPSTASEWLDWLKQEADNERPTD